MHAAALVGIRRWWLALVLVALMPVLHGTAAARDRGPLAPPDMSSPQATIRSFLELADELDSQYTAYREAQSIEALLRLARQLEKLRTLFDLRQVPPALRLKIGSEAIASLMDVLSRLPAIDLGAVPGSSADPARAPEQWVLPATEITLVRLADGSRKGSYVFSAETVERLPGFRDRIIAQPLVRPSRYTSLREEQIHLTGPWIPSALVEDLPATLKDTLFGTPRWKVIVAIVGLAIVIAINLLWSRLVRRLGASLSAPWRLLLRLTKPALLAGSYWGFHVAVNYQVNIQGRIAEGEFALFAVVCYLAAAWAAWILAFLLVESVIASPRIPDSSYDAQLLRLLGQLMALVGAGVIVVYGANEIGIPALGLFAGLGVGSLAVALAAKPTVENLFGGVTLFADRPFRVGDLISYGNTTGTVEMVGPRSSRIRGLDGTLTTVPNADLATMQITNVSNRNKCLFQHAFGLHGTPSSDQVTRLLPALRAKLAAEPSVEQGQGLPSVRVVGFGPASIKVDVRAHVLTTDFNRFLEIQERLILDLMKAVEDAGMSVASAN